MDYQVILSPLALDDLEQIVRYVASHDPQAAERLAIACSTTPKSSATCRSAAAVCVPAPV